MLEQSEIAVLLLVFNRPEQTKQVIDALRQVQPKRMYIAADGPRAHKPDEALACAQVREVVSAAIDWPCIITTLYRDQNLGCGRAVCSAITWFFKHETEGIILEDDCLPTPDWFHFCAQVLPRFRDDDRVAHVSANNFQLGRTVGDASYYFSQYPHIWGWATWRRAWQHYQFVLPTDALENVSGQLRAAMPIKMMEQVQSGQLDTWDVQWLYHTVAHQKLCVTPQINLVRNIGFSQATHTFEAPYYHEQLAFGGLPETIKHPIDMQRDQQADAFSNALLYNLSLRNQLRDKWHKMVSKAKR